MQKLAIALLIATTTVSGTALAKKKVVCWNNDQGQKMCGDTVPPQYAKQQRDVLNERGIVVETKAREKTADERAEEAQKADEAKLAEEQAKYDKYLMQTYAKASDLEAMRKERVTTLEGRLVLAEKSVIDAQKSVKDLHERVEALRKQKKEPPKQLAAQIKEYDKALVDNMQSVEALKQEREKTIAKFDKDIARHKELRPPVAPAPKP